MQFEPDYEVDMPYTLADGRKVRIRIDDSGELIEVVTDEDVPRLVGHMRLAEDEDDSSVFKLTWAYLDENQELPGYSRQGIGRRALSLHQEHFQSTIWAESNDGQVRSDGSHLTGDAPAFVDRMREEGIIARDSCCDDEWE